MKKVVLSKEEIATQAAYKKIAHTRHLMRSNPYFWHPEFEKFKQFLPITGSKVIDIGCGSGSNAFLLNQHYDYIGIDASEAMLREARICAPDADFRRMNMYALDFAEHAFDGFWASASLLHIPKRNIGIVLQEIKRVMKRGSIGFITLKEGIGEKMITGELEGDERFYALYGSAEFATVLHKNGFRVIEHTRNIYKYGESKNSTVWLVYFVRLPLFGLT